MKAKIIKEVKRTDKYIQYEIAKEDKEVCKVNYFPNEQVLELTKEMTIEVEFKSPYWNFVSIVNQTNEDFIDAEEYKTIEQDKYIFGMAVNGVLISHSNERTLLYDLNKELLKKEIKFCFELIKESRNELVRG